MATKSLSALLAAALVCVGITSCSKSKNEPAPKPKQKQEQKMTPKPTLPEVTDSKAEGLDPLLEKFDANMQYQEIDPKDYYTFISQAKIFEYEWSSAEPFTFEPIVDGINVKIYQDGKRVSLKKHTKGKTYEAKNVRIFYIFPGDKKQKCTIGISLMQPKDAAKPAGMVTHYARIYKEGKKQTTKRPDISISKGKSTSSTIDYYAQ